ncbi:MAG: PEP-CTERM sorting domain-containing protein [Caldimonas sp.]
MPSFNATLSRSRSLGGRLATTLGGAILSVLALDVAAAPSGPLSCDGTLGTGGCAPYAQVIAFGADVPAPNSIFEYDLPVLDYAPNFRNGTLRGVVDLSQVLLRTYAQHGDDGDPSNNAGVSVNAVGVDVFSLRKLGAPSPDFFTFSVVLTADGIGGIDLPGFGVAAYLSLRPDSIDGMPIGFAGGRLDDVRVLQAGNNVPVFEQFHVGLMAFANLTMRLDTPFQLSYSLRTDVSELSFLDFTHTARLSFVLPDGVSVTSMGGYDSAAVAAVPEPSTWLLMVAGLAGVARLGERRRRRAR